MCVCRLHFWARSWAFNLSIKWYIRLSTRLPSCGQWLTKPEGRVLSNPWIPQSTPRVLSSLQHAFPCLSPPWVSTALSYCCRTSRYRYYCSAWTMYHGTDVCQSYFSAVGTDVCRTYFSAVALPYHNLFPPAHVLLVVCCDQRWEGGFRNSVTVGGTKGGTAEIEFVCGDFTVLDWSDGGSASSILNEIVG